MIEPTVGRVVWFWPPRDRSSAGVARFAVYDEAQPCKADIAFVHNDTTVNLSIADHAGQHWAFENVLLWQGEGERPADRFCEWMPFQKGQAAKTEAAELAAARAARDGAT